MADANPPKDPELERLQKELARAEVEAKIAEQRTKILTQSIPASDTKPLDASTTVDSNDIIESEILAYEMLRHVARRISNHVAGFLEGKSIVMHNDADMNALAMFRTFRTQLDQLVAAFDSLAPELSTQSAAETLDLGLAVPVATMMVKSVIDLLALFRTQRAVTGVTITIDDLAFVSEVGGALANLGRPPKVYVPSVYPRGGNTSGIVDALTKVRRSSIDAAARVDKLAADGKAASVDRMSELERVKDGYEDLVTHSDGSAAISTLVRGASLDALLNEEPGAYVLYLKVLKVGGTNETKKSLFGSSLKHSGGVVVNYILFSDDGAIRASSTDHSYSGELDHVKARIE
jgi:hypothetical protein